jgi:hypothetical protein
MPTDTAGRYPLGFVSPRAHGHDSSPVTDLYHLCRPQVTMATAQVLFQRFWFVTSMKQFGIKVGSMNA